MSSASADCMPRKHERHVKARLKGIFCALSVEAQKAQNLMEGTERGDREGRPATP